MLVVAVVGIAGALSATAVAQDEPVEVRLDPGVDVPILVVTGAIALGDLTVYYRGTAGHDPTDTPQAWLPSEHLWGPDAAIANKLSGWTVEQWDADAKRRERAASASDLLLVGVPLASIAGASVLPLTEGKGAHGAVVDGTVVVETLTVSYALNAVTKHAYSRPRPYTYTTAYTRCAASRANGGGGGGNGDGDAGACEDLFDTSIADNFSSYYSGHASTTFAAAASLTTLSLVETHGHVGPVVVVADAAVVGLAATTAWLRVSAYRHFPSDVLVGAVVGTGLGVGVPLAHVAGLDQVAVSSQGGAPLLSLAGRW